MKRLTAVILALLGVPAGIGAFTFGYAKCFSYLAAENSMGFHAPQELARILAEAIDYSRQAQLAAERLGTAR
jgi:hypothetical protein